MPDYECPTCGGGFPATAATDDECPWCGRAIDGSAWSSVPHSPLRDTGIGSDDVPFTRDRPSFEDTRPGGVGDFLDELGTGVERVRERNAALSEGSE